MSKFYSTRMCLEALLRGKKNGEDYGIDECASDVSLIYTNRYTDHLFIFEKHIDYLLHLICKEFDTTLLEIKGKSRLRKHVLARHTAMYLLLKYKAGTLSSIGKLFGGRDHSTVIHSTRAISNLMQLGDTGSEQIDKITELFEKYIGDEEIKIAKDEEIKVGKPAFNVDVLIERIGSKITSINKLITSDKDVKKAVGIEKSTLENVLTLIKQINS